MLYKTKKYKSYLWPLLLLKPFHLSCKYNNWNAATSKQSKQQNACKDYIHPLNNKTTVTYVIMQTTQKDSFFFNNWFIIWNIWGTESGHFDSVRSRFDTNSSSEILQKVWLLQKKFAFEQENILGEY